MWTNNSGGVGRTGKRENPSVSSVLSKPKIGAGSADVPGCTEIDFVQLGGGSGGRERETNLRLSPCPPPLTTPGVPAGQFGGFPTSPPPKDSSAWSPRNWRA